MEPDRYRTDSRVHSPAQILKMPVKERWRVGLAWIVAYVALGLTVGWLTGLSGPDSTVLAAVLPVVVTMTVAVSAVKFGTKSGAKAVLLGAVTVVFCASLYLGIQVGIWDRDRQEESALFGWPDRAGVAQFIRLQLRQDYLLDCAEMERFLNDVRKHKYDLPPLKSEEVCVP